MISEGKNTALLFLSLSLILGISLEASAQANSPQLPKRGLVPVPFHVVDSFDSASQWTTSVAKGVELTVHADSGQHGSGLRLDFDFHGGGGYAVIHREVNLELAGDYQFKFAVRGDAPTNTLEFKLIDPTGANVWWSNNPYFVFPREWRTVARSKRQICFAWGPLGDAVPQRYDPKPPGCRLGLDISRVAAIEFAITAGSGGKGSIWLDDLSVSVRDEDDIETQTYFEFQVDKPAGMLQGTPMPRYPRGLERSGLGGEVQIQFVVRSSGKADMDTFRVLKSNHELFTEAVRNWIVGVAFRPAMINGTPVNQLVQTSLQFSVPR